MSKLLIRPCVLISKKPIRPRWSYKQMAYKTIWSYEQKTYKTKVILQANSLSPEMLPKLARSSKCFPNPSQILRETCPNHCRGFSVMRRRALDNQLLRQELFWSSPILWQWVGNRLAANFVATDKEPFGRQFCSNGWGTAWQPIF